VLLMAELADGGAAAALAIVGLLVVNIGGG
jgi:hypothetical protein